MADEEIHMREGRVLHIIDSFNMGGAETWLVEIVKYTRENMPGFPPFDFIAAGGNTAIFDDLIRSLGCRIFYLKLDKNNTGSFIQGFRKILKEHTYIAIHDHQDFLSGWHFLFGLGHLPPVRVSHVHNPHYQLYNNYGVNGNRRMKLRLGRMLVRALSTHILGTSGKVLGEYGITSQSYGRQQVRPLYCAFRIDKFSGDHAVQKSMTCAEFGWDEDVKIVLFAGRLDMSLDIGHPNNHKNSAFALEVIQACNDSKIKLIMAGANDFILEEFKGLIRAKGLESQVKLLGVRKDMTRLMVGSDILLFPSRAEGMGMVVVEAQAAGLPVLASSTTPEEVVVLKEMVDFCDLDLPFERWAEDLRRMMDERKPSGTSDDARWKASSFNIEVCCKDLQSVYANAPEKN
jgi:glycosyltransferase involved in cell wall biosynthesis